MVKSGKRKRKGWGERPFIARCIRLMPLAHQYALNLLSSAEGRPSAPEVELADSRIVRGNKLSGHFNHNQARRLEGYQSKSSIINGWPRLRIAAQIYPQQDAKGRLGLAACYLSSHVHQS